MSSTTPSSSSSPRRGRPRIGFDKAAIALSSLALIFGVAWAGLAGGSLCLYYSSYNAYDGGYYSYSYYGTPQCRGTVISAWAFGATSVVLSIMATPFQFRAFQLYYRKNPNVARTRRDLCIVSWVFYGLMIGWGISANALIFEPAIGVELVVGYVICWVIQWPCMFVYSDRMYRSSAPAATPSPAAIACATMQHIPPASASSPGAVAVRTTETVTEFPDGTKRTTREDVFQDGSAKVTVTEVRDNPDGSRTTTIHESPAVAAAASAPSQQQQPAERVKANAEEAVVVEEEGTPADAVVVVPDGDAPPQAESAAAKLYGESNV